MKFLVINLTKYNKDQYEENYKTQKENHIDKYSIFMSRKMQNCQHVSTSRNLIYRSEEISIKILTTMCYFYW